MTLYVDAAHLQAMRDHAERCYPQECCGLLLGVRQGGGSRLMEVWALENAWTAEVSEQVTELYEAEGDRPPSLKDRYWIDPKDLLEAQRDARDRQLNVIGVYHSHPDHIAVPSECDRALAWAEYSYVILSVMQGCTQDLLCWCLDQNHQFQSEQLVVFPSAPPE